MAGLAQGARHLNLGLSANLVTISIEARRYSRVPAKVLATGSCICKDIHSRMTPGRFVTVIAHTECRSCKPTNPPATNK
jgi:hypothetical protein